ncbi:MAG: response regulator [Gemmatimonadetes bacterium]|nr:response regulator [Gemmatimonadota bacterium]
MAHTVLICDDAAFMRNVLADILRQAGLQVVAEAETGKEAVEKYRELKPNLVLMDIVLPEGSGLDAVRQIIGEFPDARILVCSAVGQQSMVAEAIRAGARDYVVKPFQTNRVLEAVHRVLDSPIGLRSHIPGPLTE